MNTRLKLFNSITLSAAAFVLVAALSVTTSAGHMEMPGAPAPDPTPAAATSEPSAAVTDGADAQPTDDDTLAEVAVSLVQIVLSLL